MSQAPSLSPATFVTAAKGFSDYSDYMNAYAVTVLNQGPITAPSLPDLPTHLQNAKTHAHYWYDTLVPIVKSSIQCITAFGNSFLSIYPNMLELAKKVDNNGDVAAKQSLVKILEDFGTKLTLQISSATMVASDFGTFSASVDSDTRNFEQDYEAAKVKITGDNAQLKALQDQLNGIRDAIKRDNELLAASVIPILGIGFAIGASVDLKHQYDAAQGVNDKMAVISQDIVVLQNVSDIVTGLSTGASNASNNGAAKLEAAWQTMQQELNEFLDALNRIPTAPASFLVPAIEAAKTDWDDAIQELNSLKLPNAGTLEMYTIIRS